MSRKFCVPGVVFIFIALILNLLVTISLPWLPTLDIARSHFRNGGIQAAQGLVSITQIRFGIWAPCFYNNFGNHQCRRAAFGYVFQTTNFIGNRNNIGPGWTRALMFHPFATATTAAALILSCSTHITVTLFASAMSFFAALLTLVTFGIDIGFFIHARRQVRKLGDQSVKTNTGAGIWLTLVAALFLFLAACTVCFGRRKGGVATTRTKKTREVPVADEEASVVSEKGEHLWNRLFR